MVGAAFGAAGRPSVRASRPARIETNRTRSARSGGRRTPPAPRSRRFGTSSRDTAHRPRCIREPTGFPGRGLWSWSTSRIIKHPGSHDSVQTNQQESRRRRFPPLVNSGSVPHWLLGSALASIGLAPWALIGPPSLARSNPHWDFRAALCSAHTAFSRDPSSSTKHSDYRAIQAADAAPPGLKPEESPLRPLSDHHGQRAKSQPRSDVLIQPQWL